MASKAVAYVLGIISFFPPFNGLLRFYLKKHAHGVIYSLTAGCCWIGNILDIVQIPQLVKDANMRFKRKELRRTYPEISDIHDDTPLEISGRTERRSGGPEIEQSILRSAKNNGGITTPSEVALESEVSIEMARDALDYMVSKGFAEIRVNKSGVIVYRFPDIIDPRNEEDFEDLT